MQQSHNAPREAGIGLAIRKTITSHLETKPTGINDRMMKIRSPLERAGRCATVIRAYVPTMTNPEEMRMQFAAEMSDVIQLAPREDRQTHSWMI